MMRTQPREIYGFIPRRPSRAPTITRCILAAVAVVIIGVLTWPT
jgi:hypothetical protein